MTHQSCVKADISIKNAQNYNISLAITAILLSFLGSFLLAQVPNAFDYPVTRLINSFAHRRKLLDQIAFLLDHDNIFSGGVLIAVLWGMWFEFDTIESRADIIVGVFSAFAAGIVSRIGQYTLPSHSRPFYDDAFGFVKPFYLDDVPYNTWNSFPSDHVTVFVGFATVIAMGAWQWRWLVFAWICFVELSRTFMGAHYPADLLGGASLGAMAVLLTRTPVLTALAARLVSWGDAHKAWFYTLAFLLSYELVGLFGNIRFIVGELLRLRHAV